jgi:hypothetical protein
MSSSKLLDNPKFSVFTSHQDSPVRQVVNKNHLNYSSSSSESKKTDNRNRNYSAYYKNNLRKKIEPNHRYYYSACESNGEEDASDYYQQQSSSAKFKSTKDFIEKSLTNSGGSHARYAEVYANKSHRFYDSDGGGMTRRNAPLVQQQPRRVLAGDRQHHRMSENDSATLTRRNRNGNNFNKVKWEKSMKTEQKNKNL